MATRKAHQTNPDVRARSTTSRSVSASAATKRQPFAAAPERINRAPAAPSTGKRGVVRPQLTAGTVGGAASLRPVLSGSRTEPSAEELEQLRCVQANARREQQQLQGQLADELRQKRQLQEQLTLLQAELGDHRAAINITAERERAQKELDAELDALKKQHARVLDEKEQHYQSHVLSLEHDAKEATACLERELQQARRELDMLQKADARAQQERVVSEKGHSKLRVQVAHLEREVEELKVQLSSAASDEDGLRAENAYLKTELREAEALRRKLHNEVQELRGNIRVFARVRPAVRNDAVQAANGGSEATLADFRYPGGRDANQLEVVSAGESATGAATLNRHAFTFDRVFDPRARQEDVFSEIANLVQSVLDGFNVSIFAYGQTGSGKTHTLEGPPDYFNLPSSSSSTGDDMAHPDSGMIPRAVHLLWRLAQQLQSVGWNYTFEGQMLEIYLDTINDLLGQQAFDKSKHEVKHDINTGRTTVTGTVSVALHSPAEVFSLLEKAKKRRQVAATLMNERSSRSHSVFVLRARGANPQTGERSDATLNLVDLAGSERLSNSGSAANPQRLREAQSINKSLSALADVIAALSAAQNGGKAPAHVPYRNSTLTWLLKNSLGGNSKTLMLLALSPMLAHQSESLCSLRFATKVNSTHVGPAKRIRATD